jgi:hypothetical protein
MDCLTLLKWPLGPAWLVSDVLVRSTYSQACQQALQGQNMHTLPKRLPVYGPLSQMRSMRMRSAPLIALEGTCIRSREQVQPLAISHRCFTICSGLQLTGLL